MAHSSTKSIDVGGVFLMDLIVNESECDDDHPADATQNGDNHNVRWNATNHHQDKSIRLSPTYRPDHQSQYSSLCRTSKATNIVVGQQSRLAPSRPKTATTTTQGTSNDYLGSSLDRLASVINCDGQKQENDDDDGKPVNEHDVEHSPIGAYHQTQQPYDFKELQSSCSLSDESYVASGEVSLTASLAYSSEEQEFEDRGSTTTREDSGVLDMKDLEGQLNNGSYDYDDEQQHDHHRRASSNSASKKPNEQEKSISSNIMATNLINNSANGNKNFQYQQQVNIDYHKQQQQQHRSINKPTDDAGNITKTTNNNHHHHNSNKIRSNHPGRLVAASLPIEVPARQMKRKLNRMKLNLLHDEEQQLPIGAAVIEQKPEKQTNATDNSPVRRGDRNRPAFEEIVAFDDDEAFLDQEFNANHHNRYPIDELDRENLTAKDDPMKLFASIQALARSLHEDAELFGSLPPKRMLESPIRSIALV